MRTRRAKARRCFIQAARTARTPARDPMFALCPAEPLPSSAKSEATPMARIVLGLGSSHTPMLLVDAADLPRYEENDRRLPLLDTSGAPTMFDAQLTAAGDGPDVTPEALTARHTMARQAIAGLADALAGAALDALIVIGDDQQEMLKGDQHPALMVYDRPTMRSQRRPHPPGRTPTTSPAPAGRKKRLLPPRSGGPPRRRRRRRTAVVQTRPTPAMTTRTLRPSAGPARKRRPRARPSGRRRRTAAATAGPTTAAPTTAPRPSPRPKRAKA